MSKEILYTIEVNKVDLELKVSLWNYIKYKFFRLNKDEAFKEFAQEIWKKASETSNKNLQEAIWENEYVKGVDVGEVKI